MIGQIRNQLNIRQEIQDILVDCYGPEEEASAWGVAFEDEVSVPATARMLGMPVEVRGFRVGDDNRIECLVAREKQERWIGVVDLDEDGMPKDMAHMLGLHRVWVTGDF